MSGRKLPNESELGSPGQGDSDAVERIVDPDNYTHRRRLRQLHDAKERVVERKNAAVLEWQLTREFTEQRRDLLVAEVVVDYVQELASVLQKRAEQNRGDQSDEIDEDEFLEQTVSINDRRSITLDQFATNRGRLDGEPIDYRTSMQVWATCNRYFEEVAGAEFEQESLPRESGFNSVPKPPSKGGS